MEIKAPATAIQGSTVTLDVNVTDTVPLSQGWVGGDGTMTIAIGGAGSGRVTTTDAYVPEIPPGTPFRLVGGKAEVPLPNVGDVTFTPARFTYENRNGVTVQFCSTTNAAVAEIIHVTAS